MKVYLNHIRAIDVHCHPYEENKNPYTPQQFLQKLSLSVLPNMFNQMSQTSSVCSGANMYMQITIQRLSKLFSCSPNLQEVVQCRNERAKNFSQYTQFLMEDANIRGMVVDFGYPTPFIQHQKFQQIVNVPIWEVSRIETIMENIKNKRDSFHQFVDKFRFELQQTLKSTHVVGLKSIIAYRSGLEVGEKNAELAEKDYESFKNDSRSPAKYFRDYCLHIAMEECTEANKVMHIHTGIGDGEVVLKKSSPSMLLDLLRMKKYGDTKVHLVHGGYPWMEEAAYMTSILPNVYLDFSLQNPFIGHGVERILSQIFEMAPFNKVLFGSDAFTVPEMNWLGVHLFKECFGRVLSEWINRDYIDYDGAIEIAELVLYKNFETIYKEQLKGALV